MALTALFCQQSQHPGVSVGAPVARLQEPPRQASPTTQGLPRAMETKAVLASYIQFCYWAKGRPCSPGHTERGEGEEVEGGLRLPGLCQPGSDQWDRVGLSCGFWGLDGVLRGSHHGSDIRLVQGLRVVEMGLIYPEERPGWGWGW